MKTSTSIVLVAAAIAAGTIPAVAATGRGNANAAPGGHGPVASGSDRLVVMNPPGTSYLDPEVHPAADELVFQQAVDQGSDSECRPSVPWQGAQIDG